MPTLALNIITYEKDQEELKRCLESCKGSLFDERIIVDTTTEASTAILAICQEYGCKYFHFAWCDDFSAARNYALDNTTTEYMLWLDSDDIIKPTEYLKIQNIKPKLHEFDMYLFDYVYAHDENDNTILVLPRERIVKVCPETRWQDPIHEAMTVDMSRKMARLCISIDHYRKHGTHERNKKLLDKAFANNSSERIKFYYAKEHFDSMDYEKSVKVFEDYIETAPGKDSVDNQATACHKLCIYYLRLENENIGKAIYYAYKSIGLTSKYAEPYYFLGLIFEYKNVLAFDFYKKALTKTLDAGLGQLPDYYRYLPARQLAFLYARSNHVEEARKYATIARISKTDDELENLVASIGGAIEVKPLWLLSGKADDTNGSYRIRRKSIHSTIPSSRLLEYYQQHRFNELIELIKNYNVFVFMNFSLIDLNLMIILRNMHKVVVFDHCENIWGYPYQHECMQAATIITCCSTVLAQETEKHGYKSIVVIPDAIEQPKQIKQDYSSIKLKAGFFGMGGNSWLVTSWLKDTIEQAGYELVNCTEWPNATIKWDLNTWQDEMFKCDVILCPQRVDIQPAKSNNKVTQAMAMGLPVICSPLQAYKEVVSHGQNGYIANTLQEWKECLELLKDENKRKEIGTEATKNLDLYSLKSVSTTWQKIMTELLQSIQPEVPATQLQNKQNVPTETIDIIIPNYNNWPYLRLCLDSILQNTIGDYRVIISDAGSNKETWNELKQLKGFTILGSQDKRLNFSQACNAGIKIGNSKYFVILNSDTIVSKNWLANIKNKMGTQDRLAACGVLSNCDAGWLHGVPGKPKYNMNGLHPGMKLEQIKPNLDALYSFMETSNIEHKDEFVEQAWVAAYATMYARSAIQEVGLFDERYESGCEDLDLHTRLSAFGYRSGQAIDAFVLHFGGISRYVAQQENKELYDEQDKTNHIKYKTKWAQKKIAIFTGPAWESWNEEKVEQGMAGSETWAVYIAHAFEKQGYKVFVFNQRQDINTIEEIDNVFYIDYRRMEEFLQYEVVDYFISSRNVESLKQNIHSLKNYVMIHDVFLSPDRNYDLQQNRVQKYFYLSNWHKEFIQQWHNIPESKLHKTANGIPMQLYKDVDSYEKKNQAIYSSSPDRGLWQLLQMLPAIRKEIPDFTLYIAYGFHNWESMAKQRNDIKGLEFIEQIKQAMQQEGVVYLGRISKQELAKYEMQSKVLLYPTWFDETFCITAATAGIAKCAILSTAKGGLLDTVGDCGILLPSDGLKPNETYPEPYVAQFVETAIKLLRDDALRCSWANKAYNKMQAYNWATIAQDLIKLFTKGV